MKRMLWAATLITIVGGAGCHKKGADTENALLAARQGEGSRTALSKPEAEWKRILPPNRYHVLREKGTERAFTGEYWDHHAKGDYLCAGCGATLFASEHKFDSGTGWPSFWQPAAKSAVRENLDSSAGISRTETVCERCGGHLGHVFSDGPAPTGLRYCINSASLRFRERAEKKNTMTKETVPPAKSRQ